MGYIKSLITENKLGSILCLTILSLSTLGARLEQHYALMGMVIVVCTLIGLAVYDKIKPNFYPTLLYIISLSLLFQTSLLSNYLIGADIHAEAHWANLALREGWNPMIPALSNTSIPIGIVIPTISKITGVSIEWIIKGGVPFLFACVPSILYFLFKRWGTDKEAFLGSIFFIIMPSFFMEIPGIVKQQFAEVCITTTFLVVFTKLRLRLKVPILVTAASLAVLSHYSMMVVFGVFILIGFIMKVTLRVKMQTPTWVFGLLVIVVAVTGGVYYSRVASGLSLRYMTALIPVPTQEIDLPFSQPVMIGPIPDEERVEPILRPDIGYGEYPTVPQVQAMSEHSVLMQAALGLDFPRSPPAGKGFRVLQYITEILILIGIIQLLRKRRKDFLILAGGGITILAFCIFWPGFSAILNASRFYHLSLFALAPTLVVGGKLMFKGNLKLLTVCLLIPYFIFTSGFFFEAMQYKNTDVPSIPFSVALTNYRIDLGGSITEDDEGVRDWLAEQDEKVYGDAYSVFFLQEKTGFRKDIVFPPPNKELPRDGYLFLRSRNQEEQKVTYWYGIGLRRVYTYEEAGIAGALEEREVVYQIGDSIVLGVGTDEPN